MIILTLTQQELEANDSETEQGKVVSFSELEKQVECRLGTTPDTNCAH